MSECRCAARNFLGQGGGRFVELKKSVKEVRPAGSFLLDTFKATCWMKNWTQGWTQSDTFFQKLGQFFSFLRRLGEASPLPFSCTPVTEYAWISQYPGICLNILENAWMNYYDYARSLNKYDHLNFQQDLENALGSKWAKVLNIARLYIQGLRRIPNMSDYGSIRLKNAWICLNKP